MPSNDAFRSFVIVNPAAAAGGAGRRWNRMAALLTSTLGNFDHAMTRGQGDATTLTRAALRQGFEMIVCVGGDGTLNEIGRAHV